MVKFDSHCRSLTLSEVEVSVALVHFGEETKIPAIAPGDSFVFPCFDRQSVGSAWDLGSIRVDKWCAKKSEPPIL